MERPDQERLRRLTEEFFECDLTPAEGAGSAFPLRRNTFLESSRFSNNPPPDVDDGNDQSPRMKKVTMNGKTYTCVDLGDKNVNIGRVGGNLTSKSSVVIRH